MKQYKQSYICVAKYGAQLEKKNNQLTPILNVFSFAPLITSAEVIHLPLYINVSIRLIIHRFNFPSIFRMFT